MQIRIHCTAPPITEENLAAWYTMFDASPMRPVLMSLYQAVKDCKAGVYIVMPKQKLDALGQMLDSLAEPIRTPAYHCLWAVTEMALGRKPTFA